MPSLFDPFGTPDAATNPTPEPSRFNELQTAWKGFLDDPKGRAAIVNFGLNLMQPVGLGQSAVGHLASSVGATGGALTAQEEQERKQKDTDTKEALAEARAQRVADRAAYESGRLGLTQLLGSQRRDTEAQRLDFLSRKLDTQTATAKEKLELQGLIESQKREMDRLKLESGERRTKDINQQRLDREERQRLDRLDRESRAKDERDLGALDREASRQASEINKQVNDITGGALAPEHLKKYRGRSYGDIKADLLNDPAFKQNWERIRTQTVPSNVPSGLRNEASPDENVPDEQGDVSDETQTAPAVQSPYEGQTATNAQTGQKVQFKNGRWVYL